MISRGGPAIIGLTGSIGMGKSTVAAMFARAGVPVFDADAEVRAMQGPGGQLVAAIEDAFPGSTGPDGVDRDALGAIVFGDNTKLATLEAIVHPAVASRRQRFLARRAGHPVITGLSMLIGQAAASFELFFGVEPPREHDGALIAMLTQS